MFHCCSSVCVCEREFIFMNQYYESTQAPSNMPGRLFWYCSCSNTILRTKWTWNLWEMQRKWCNYESSVLCSLSFNCAHQIFIHQRQLHAPFIIVLIFMFFFKNLNPSPYHSITHWIFFINLPTSFFLAFKKWFRYSLLY